MKKLINPKSPDVKKLKAVAIDLRTVIYIAEDADPEEAKARYLERFKNKKV